MNESTYVVIQAEGRAALDRIADIAGVAGIDAIFVGPYDLALSLGVEPGSAPVYEAAQAMAEQVPESMALGIYLDDPGSSDRWAERGFSLQCIGFDGRMLADGARDVLRRATGAGAG